MQETLSPPSQVTGVRMAQNVESVAFYMDSFNIDFRFVGLILQHVHRDCRGVETEPRSLTI